MVERRKLNIEAGAGVIANPWHRLREFTDARIGLGRAGVSIPTRHLLAFQLAHARAQDSVHFPLDTQRLLRALCELETLPQQCPPLLLHSRAADRSVYLQRPDLGRRLDDASAELLREREGRRNRAYDLAIVIADGLSSLAVQKNTGPFLKHLLQALEHAPFSSDNGNAQSEPWLLAPLSIVQQGRVAIGDEVGELLGANAVAVLIGERPGLSSPDSLGLYLTWGPKVGLTDASRNCISNIREAGLNYADAVRKLMYLLHESRRRRLSGVQLKERSEEGATALRNDEKNFLVS